MSPTPVQEQAIPILQTGRDLLAQAQTGTGKTAAFAIPILARVAPGAQRPQALVIVPTRELAVQVTREFAVLGRYRDSHETAIYGGVSYSAQDRALRRGVGIVIGTPGRILDHIERGTLDLRGIEILILDEADRLLDMGFAPEVRRLLRKVTGPHQTALFSATLGWDVRDLASRSTELEAHRGRPIIAICRSGVRSTTAAAILYGLGFERVYNLKDGMVEWNDRKLAVEH